MVYVAGNTTEKAVSSGRLELADLELRLRLLKSCEIGKTCKYEAARFAKLENPGSLRESESELKGRL
jgi:hypothetical protein